MTEAAGPAPAALRPGPVILVLLASTAAAAVVAFLPLTLAAAVAVLCGLLVVAFWSFLRPLLLAHLVIWSAAFGGLWRHLDEIGVGGATITLSGVRWLGIAAGAAALLALRPRTASVPLYFLPLYAFFAWMLLRWLAAGANPGGASDLLFYLLPALIGTYGYSALVADGPAGARSIERSLQSSIVVPILLYTVTLQVGLVQITPAGPKGIIGPRPVATFLLVILASALASVRYRPGRRWRYLGLALLASALIIFTASRLATVVALLLWGVFSLHPRRLSRLLPRALLAVAMAAGVLTLAPSLRDRLFHHTPVDLREAIQQVQLSGRDQMWRATIEHGWQRPLVGWGAGSARPVVAEALLWKGRDEPPTSYPPHNEYLQVFHDGGLIGLALLLTAWAMVLMHHGLAWRRQHRLGARDAARLHWTGVLLVISVLISAAGDNTLHYPVVLAPMFLLLAAADRASGPPPSKLLADDSNEEPSHA